MNTRINADAFNISRNELHEFFAECLQIVKRYQSDLFLDFAAMREMPIYKYANPAVYVFSLRETGTFFMTFEDYFDLFATNSDLHIKRFTVRNYGEYFSFRAF